MPEAKDFIQIDTGRKHVPVRDPYGNDSHISFNPSDADFRQRYFDVALDIDRKTDEYKDREAELDKLYPAVKKPDKDKTDEDKRNELLRASEENKMFSDLCNYCEEAIDGVFGEGTSKKVFGGDRVYFAYARFFKAISPWVQESVDDAKGEYIQRKGNRQQRRTKP